MKKLMLKKDVIEVLTSDNANGLKGGKGPVFVVNTYTGASKVTCETCTCIDKSCTCPTELPETAISKMHCSEFGCGSATVCGETKECNL